MSDSIQDPHVIEPSSMDEYVCELLGGPIQAFMPYEHSTMFFCRADHRELDLSLNRVIRDPDGTIYGYINGSFIVCGLYDDTLGIPKDKFPERIIEFYLHAYEETR